MDQAIELFDLLQLAGSKAGDPMDLPPRPVERVGENRRFKPPRLAAAIESYLHERERRLQDLITLRQFGAAFQPEPIDVRMLRRRLRMTRAEFSRRFGFPVETVRHWERGDRTPRRGALVLLNLIARNATVALRLLRKRI